MPSSLEPSKSVLAVQASQASVAGTIRDGESGAPLPDAVVTLTDVDRAALSDGSGRYGLSAVPPGPLHLVPMAATASRSRRRLPER